MSVSAVVRTHVRYIVRAYHGRTWAVSVLFVLSCCAYDARAYRIVMALLAQLEGAHRLRCPPG